MLYLGINHTNRIAGILSNDPIIMSRLNSSIKSVYELSHQSIKSGISLMDSYSRGIAGTIPGMEFLEQVIYVWKALENGDVDAAYRAWFPLCALVSLQLQAGLDGFLAVEKYIMKRKGLFSTDRRRQPYEWEMDKETCLELERLLRFLSH